MLCLPAEAGEHGEVVVLSVPWTQAADALKLAGSLKDKILIDCTNPMEPDMSGLAVGHGTSAAEEVAKMATGAEVVKAFNSTFAAVMHSPSRRPPTSIAAITAPQRQVVSGLIKETGLEPLDVGHLMCARYLEPLAMLAIQIAFVQGLARRLALGC